MSHQHFVALIIMWGGALKMQEWKMRGVDSRGGNAGAKKKEL